MPFIPAPNIVMAEVRASLAGQDIENRFMIDVLTTPDAALVSDVANIVNVWAQGTYFDHLPNAVTLREVVATDLTTSDGAQHTITPTGPFTGALTEEPMPNEVSFCISLRSGSRGRSARGRMYVLAMTKFAVVGNFLNAARADLHRQDMQDLIDVVAGQGWQMVVVSYVTNNAPRPGGPVYYPIVTATFEDLTVDSMRRRKPGVGS